ncbi:MAG: S8 family serine peptidase [Planctomycetota bacterium]
MTRPSFLVGTALLLAQVTPTLSAQDEGPRMSPRGTPIAPHLKSTPIDERLDPNEPLPGELAGTERWIVRFRRSGVDLDELKRAREKGIDKFAMQQLIDEVERGTLAWHEPVAEVVHDLGGVVRGHLWIVDSMEIEVAPEALAQISAHPRVRKLEPCVPLYPGSARDRTAVPAAGVAGARALPIDTAIDRNHHNAVAVHALGFEGQGIQIGFADTAFDDGLDTSTPPNPTFFIGGDVTSGGGMGIGGSRLITVRPVPFDNPDVEVHGTFVAAIAAGETWNDDPQSSPGHAPLARIFGWECAFNDAGFTSNFVLAGVYQDALTRALRFGQPRIVNNGFEGNGRTTGTGLEQDAADRLARIGDVLSVMLAGNETAVPTCTSNWSLNSVQVGFVSNFDRVLAPESARFDTCGLVPPTTRLFPHVVANGVGINGPFANTDLTGFGAVGSSFASPQVAGAAALFFEADPARTALEARAAILASTEDIRNRNSGAALDGIGTGYLRDDRLFDMAMGQGLLTRGVLANIGAVQTFPVTVPPGEQLSVALVWERQDDFQNALTAQLRLRVLDGMTELARGAMEVDCAAHLRVLGPASGLVTVEVTLVMPEPGFPSADFAVGAITEPAPISLGTISEFGVSCGPNSFVVDRPAMIGDQHGVFPEFIVDAPAVPVLVVGGSAASTPVGTMGCTLLVNPAASAPISGTQITFVPVPVIPSLVGSQIHEQLVIFDPAQPDGFYLTESAILTVGGVN